MVWFLLGLFALYNPAVDAHAEVTEKQLIRGLFDQEYQTTPSGAERLWHEQQPVPSFDGVAQLRAYRLAYPDRVTAIDYRDGDWAALVNGRWYYWAHGRLLPAKARPFWERYSPHRLYDYTTGPYVIPVVDDAQAAVLATWLDRQRLDPPERHNGFLGSLYGTMTPSQARGTMVSMRLLGFHFRAHPLLLRPIQRVDAELSALVEANPDVRRFFATIQQVDGQYWRRIAGTISVSYHSYGIAVDLLPRGYARTFPYWRWAAEAGVREWWAVPINRRWLVPPEVVEVFERHGFVWGGRWLFYDAIHFEYRPEVFIINAIRRGEAPPTFR
jgi:hypothetical protein